MPLAPTTTGCSVIRPSASFRTATTTITPTNSIQPDTGCPSRPSDASELADRPTGFSTPRASSRPYRRQLLLRLTKRLHIARVCARLSQSTDTTTGLIVCSVGGALRAGPVQRESAQQADHDAVAEDHPNRGMTRGGRSTLYPNRGNCQPGGMAAVPSSSVGLMASPSFVPPVPWSFRPRHQSTCPQEKRVTSTIPTRT